MALAVAWGIVLAGGDQGARYAGFSVFFWCAAVAFLIQWVMFIHAWSTHSEAYFDLTGSITHILVIVMGLVMTGHDDVGSLVAETKTFLAVWPCPL